MTGKHKAIVVGGGVNAVVDMKISVMPGQLFIAREAGPEFVGSFGTRTAVMNNNQIVESVSRGVAMANMGEMALLREQNDLLRILINKKGSIAIGEREFGEVVVNALNRRTYELGDSGLRKFYAVLHGLFSRRAVCGKLQQSNKKERK